jgi:hypothetical protein
MSHLRPFLASIGLALVIGCGGSEPAAPPPKAAKKSEDASLDKILGASPPQPSTPATPAASPGPPIPKPASPPPQVDNSAAESREYANYENSSRQSDWNKRLQMYVNEHKGKFPDSVEELAKAFNVPVPKLPDGAMLYIDRSNKVVRLKKL